jgi:hypothetical protein
MEKVFFVAAIFNSRVSRPAWLNFCRQAADMLFHGWKVGKNCKSVIAMK